MGVASYSGLGWACLDAKRVIAYSTAWHVGILSILAITSNYVLIQHLLAHAVFKSTLFMVVGLLLHAVGSQDSRALPSISKTGMVCYSSALCIYQSIGWVHSPTWSTKKIAIDSMSSMASSWSVMVIGAIVGMLLSVAYTVVLLVYVMLSATRSVVSHHSIHDLSYVMGGSIYVALLACSSHASSAMSTMGLPIHVYAPQAITSHYVGWWYALQVVSALLVMLSCRATTSVAPSYWIS